MLAAGQLAFSASLGAASPITSIDEIENWTGIGPNRSALVIDWSELAGAGPSMAWGYCWDDAATGRDMLVDIVQADPRLYVKLNASRTLLLGVGYDLNNDGELSLAGTTFDADGFAVGTIGSVSFVNTAGDGDVYQEGWNIKFWHYAAQVGGLEGVWEHLEDGIADHDLVDGAIDGWTYATARPPNYAAFPDQPNAAEPMGLPGDFNLDGRVDAADYTVWRDANGHSQDYLLWRSHYGQTASLASSTSLAVVPEPRSALLILAGAALSFFLCHRQPAGRLSPLGVTS